MTMAGSHFGGARRGSRGYRAAITCVCEHSIAADILRSKFQQSNLTCGSGLFGISVPSYLLHIASGGHTIIAGAVAAVVSGTLAKFALDRKITAGSSPYSYLLDVESFMRKETPASELVSLNLENPDDCDERLMA
jgi:hypothetical protein